MTSLDRLPAEPQVRQALTKLVDRNAKLRRAVQELRQDVELAVATIARLTLDNHQLQTELEQARQITNIKSRSPSD